MPRASLAPISCLGLSRIGSIRSSSPVAPRADTCARPRSMPARTGSVLWWCGRPSATGPLPRTRKVFSISMPSMPSCIVARRARLSRTRRLQFRRAELMDNALIGSCPFPAQEEASMDNKLYDYSPIVGRPKLAWPNGARLAFYIGLNIEHFEVDKPATSIFGATSSFVPDPLNYGWRDYGVRVGIWRMIDALDKHGMRASVLLNADVCEHYPQIIEAGRKRNWAWLAHGKNNSIFRPA